MDSLYAIYNISILQQMCSENEYTLAIMSIFQSYS